MLRTFKRIKEWEQTYEERRKLAFIEDVNQYVTCRQFKVWRRSVIAAFIILALGGIGNQYADRYRSQDARAALVKSGRIVSVDGCNRDFRTIQGNRGVLLAAEAAVAEQYRQGLITKEQFDRSNKFYDERLGTLRLPDCREAQNVLTDDPERAGQAVPRPLYPGSPEENIVIGDPNPNEGRTKVQPLSKSG